MITVKQIILATQRPAPDDDLKTVLQSMGVEKIECISVCQDLYAHVSKSSPEAIIIEVSSLDEDLLQQIRSINQALMIPVILFTDTDEDIIIEKAIKNGVATYIVGVLDVHRIQSILQVAITRFNEIQKLKHDLTTTRAQLEERKIIDKAKGILMQHKQYSEDDAYKALRKMAMDKNKRIVDIAEGIIAAFDLLA